MNIAHGANFIRAFLFMVNIFPTVDEAVSFFFHLLFIFYLSLSQSHSHLDYWLRVNFPDDQFNDNFLLILSFIDNTLLRFTFNVSQQKNLFFSIFFLQNRARTVVIKTKHKPYTGGGISSVFLLKNYFYHRTKSKKKKSLKRFREVPMERNK